MRTFTDKIPTPVLIPGRSRNDDLVCSKEAAKIKNIPNTSDRVTLVRRGHPYVSNKYIGAIKLCNAGICRRQINIEEH